MQAGWAWLHLIHHLLFYCFLTTYFSLFTLFFPSVLSLHQAHRPHGHSLLAALVFYKIAPQKKKKKKKNTICIVNFSPTTLFSQQQVSRLCRRILLLMPVEMIQAEKWVLTRCTYRFLQKHMAQSVRVHRGGLSTSQSIIQYTKCILKC